MKKGASAEEKRARLEKCTLLNPPRQVIVKRKEDPKAEPLVVGEVVGEVSIISGDADYKHVLHRIRQTEEASSDGSQYAYRLGYWTFTGDGRSVKWGQYHAILSEKEWADLMRQARDKGWGI